ncbi:MAG TPA: MBL fold metallo-hydrolase [Steroidobacteraceae bacterium]|nr:MBL fold metallo-hydrolase [Steroidobacteraceae bacterium]
MTVRQWTTLAVLALLAATAEAQQQDFSKVEIKTQQVAGNVYMLTGAGGNIGALVGDDGILIIDDQFAPLSPKIHEALAKLSPKPVKFLVNTHYHGDHTGGNEIFGREGSIIVAQENVRKRLSERQVIELFKMDNPPAPKEALPVITFTEDVGLHLDGEDLRVFHVPNAHTDGDSLIYFSKANVLHAGDTLFNGFYPFIDVGGGGSINGMIGSADKVLGMINDDTKIIPGHGPLATPKDLKAFRDMLATVRDNVAKLVKEGKSADEVVAAQPAKDVDAVWGKGFLKAEQFVRIVYSDLSRPGK